MNTWEILWRILLSAGLGALLGLERDSSRKTKKDKAYLSKSSRLSVSKFSFITSAIPASGLGGVRTYTLIAMLGSMAGITYNLGFEVIAYIVCIIFGLFVVASYVLNYFDKNSLGLTTEISVLLCFTNAMLLFATNIPPKIIIAVTVIDAIVLSMRNQLHKVVAKFSEREVIDTIKFLLVTLVILPFLPNVNYSIMDLPSSILNLLSFIPSDLLLAINVFNPFVIWMVVVVVSAVNFVGYFLIRIMGQKRGLEIAGFLGGIVSSTAVTQAMAESSKCCETDEEKKTYVAGALLANLVSFLRVGVMTFILSFDLGLRIMPSLLIASALIVSVVSLINRSSSRVVNTKNIKSKTPHKNNVVDFRSPFSFVPALRLGSLFVVVLVFTKVALYFLGGSGFIISSIVASVSGLDAVTINTVDLVNSGVVTTQLAATVLVISLCANLVVKMIFSGFWGDRYFNKRISVVFFVVIFAAALTLLITNYILI